MSRGWMDVSTGSGVRRRVRFDHETGRMVRDVSQPNMQAILDQNHRHKNMHNAKASQLRPGETWMRVASIPFWLIEHWKTTEGLDYFNEDHRPALMAKLNSLEYEKLRTAHGAIAPNTKEF